MIVTYICSDESSDQFRVQIRCRNLVEAISRTGWHRAYLLDLRSFIENNSQAQQLCGISDLLVIHRYLYGEVFPSIAYWRARDKKVILDVDQAVDHLTPDIPGHSFWFDERQPERAVRPGGWSPKVRPAIGVFEQFKWGLGQIDAVTVSSTRLAIDWSRFASVHELPDYLNTDQYPATKQPHAGEVWIGLSADCRPASTAESGMLSALAKVCRSRPQVRLALGAFDDERPASCAIPTVQRIVSPLTAAGQWADLLLQLDLGLAPAHGEYDLRLGRIGLLELMISKIPWIASDQPSFRELTRYGRLVQNTAVAWEAALLKAVDNLEALKRRAAGEPFLYALSQDVHENVGKILKLYAGILNRDQ